MLRRKKHKTILEMLMLIREAQKKTFGCTNAKKQKEISCTKISITKGKRNKTNKYKVEM